MDPGSYLFRESLASCILTMSLLGDSLLVYCQDNTLLHFLIIPSTLNGTGFSQDTPRLVQLGQINFRGIIHSPTRVRSISWILPDSQAGFTSLLVHTLMRIEISDPAEDAATASIVFLLDGKLVLLRPTMRHEAPVPDLKYDMKVLSEKVEWFMIHTDKPEEPSMPTLKASIWAWDGSHINVSLSRLC